VVRGSVRLIAAAATRLRSIAVVDLVPSDVEAWRDLRGSLQQRQTVRTLGRRFRREERWAKTGKLKLRDAEFNTITRQARFELPARDDITFRHLMLDLFDKEWPPGRRRTVRLVGFGVTDITDSPEDPQPSLFGPSPLAEQMKKRERLAAALDALARGRQR
jgi:nucleotidyltransferase/DNA polymerase involved in DNA repair